MAIKLFLYVLGVASGAWIMYGLYPYLTKAKTAVGDVKKDLK